LKKKFVYLTAFFVCATVLSLKLAHAQSQATTDHNKSRDEQRAAEFRFDNQLAQARPMRRAGFSLIPASNNGNTGASGSKMTPTGVPSAKSDDEKVVAALDTEYQAAVQRNEAATMDRILADDFVLVTGRGNVYTKADLLEGARAKKVSYEHQEDSQQKVRVWGNTAVITALLWAKGTKQGKPFEDRLWFSDTYVRTPSGWRYVFGQASIPLPKIPR
jgi:ketosteroid isomerase-like protein